MFSKVIINLSDKEIFNKAMDKVINSYEHRGLRFNPMKWAKNVLNSIIEKIMNFILERGIPGLKSTESAKKSLFCETCPPCK